MAVIGGVVGVALRHAHGIARLGAAGPVALAAHALVAALVDGLARLVQLAAVLAGAALLAHARQVVAEDEALGARARLDAALARVVVVLVVAGLGARGRVLGEHLVQMEMLVE